MSPQLPVQLISEDDASLSPENHLLQTTGTNSPIEDCRPNGGQDCEPKPKEVKAEVYRQHITTVLLLLMLSLSACSPNELSQLETNVLHIQAQQVSSPKVRFTRENPQYPFSMNGFPRNLGDYLYEVYEHDNLFTKEIINLGGNHAMAIIINPSDYLNYSEQTTPFEYMLGFNPEYIIRLTKAQTLETNKENFETEDTLTHPNPTDVIPKSGTKYPYLGSPFRKLRYIQEKDGTYKTVPTDVEYFLLLGVLDSDKNLFPLTPELLQKSITDENLKFVIFLGEQKEGEDYVRPVSLALH